MELSKKDRKLIDECLGWICRHKTTSVFMYYLKGFSQGRGIGGEMCPANILLLKAETMDEEEIELYGGKRFDGVVFDEGCEFFDTAPVILTYQEFYDFLRKYVEEAIIDMDAEFQAEARKYLLLFKERYHLK
ncbi:MAG: hypothetical protein K6E36_11260 [Oscillospiraceae bacterium]|nr:hypothetical protein [Oscillospiraceae bacterium]